MTHFYRFCIVLGRKSYLRLSALVFPRGRLKKWAYQFVWQCENVSDKLPKHSTGTIVRIPKASNTLDSRPRAPWPFDWLFAKGTVPIDDQIFGQVLESLWPIPSICQYHYWLQDKLKKKKRKIYFAIYLRVQKRPTNLLRGNNRNSLTILILSSVAERPWRTCPNAKVERKTNLLRVGIKVGPLAVPKRSRPSHRMLGLH